MSIPEKFYQALGQIESNNKPKAVGDNGRAIGIYQIHKSYWQDAVDFNKSIKGRYSDCFNVEYSKKIVQAYFNRYERESIKNQNFENLARCHNGGYNWRNKREKTNNYWAKFKLILMSQN